MALADDLATLASLRDSGTISFEEFELSKAHVLRQARNAAAVDAIRSYAIAQPAHALPGTSHIGINGTIAGGAQPEPLSLAATGASTGNGEVVGTEVRTGGGDTSPHSVPSVTSLQGGDSEPFLLPTGVFLSILTWNATAIALMVACLAAYGATKQIPVIEAEYQFLATSFGALGNLVIVFCSFFVFRLSAKTACRAGRSVTPRLNYTILAISLVTACIVESVVTFALQWLKTDVTTLIIADVVAVGGVLAGVIAAKRGI